MKTFEITEASLADYDDTSETWVLTRDGKPVAAVVPLRPDMDAETLGMSHDPQFIEIVNRSWKSYKEGRSRTLEEMRQRHGVARKQAPRKPSRRSR